MKTTCCIAVLVSVVIASSAYARDCTSDEQDWAEYVAEPFSRQIVDEFGGGQDIVSTLTACSFNDYSDRYRLRLRTDWNGAMIRSNHYAIEGQLELAADGRALSWSQLAESESVTALREDLIGLAVGAIILGGIASALEEDVKPSP